MIQFMIRKYLTIEKLTTCSRDFLKSLKQKKAEIKSNSKLRNQDQVKNLTMQVLKNQFFLQRILNMNESQLFEIILKGFQISILSPRIYNKQILYAFFFL
ncbi:hypothetical protein TTHERM_000842699 (macronuclear) [Tetrahymena thermophila SB210]|uniref:Uncharacterized protein n=1 Tax=Tetrahymena thermophila (strain SB210) TaxID=312017 RepID=W7WWC9_TETTS|nr:hypothetical protein TTHERM_000842699 [Tetrahymena thermophila SB210]EWS71135.1 hypothetical protein TTHERM_000842699 [Tetrahymena thermophila SB210]|eukprot:XP_012656343.1 hypothetical protein TTHERM_000842699 [Tetrahymena thermophila SB210]